jgi:serine/threonine protein kinase
MDVALSLSIEDRSMQTVDVSLSLSRDDKPISCDDQTTSRTGEMQYRVDAIVHKKMSTAIHKADRAIRAWLSEELAIDREHIDIQLHLTNPTASGNVITIIYPVLCDREPSDSTSIEQLIKNEADYDCRVELIPVKGLNHLFYKNFSDSCPRNDYLANNEMPNVARDLLALKANELEYDRKTDFIKEGRFSEVFKVNMRSLRSPASLKQYFGGNSERFLNEYRTFLEVGKHGNIIDLTGIYMCSGSANIGLVLEHADHGDLDTLLTYHLNDHREIKADYNWQLRARMALDVAKGMDFLHRKIVHLDLKTSNVLVTKGYLCKISDFDSAEFPHEPETSQFGKCEIESANTVVFISPERFKGNNHWNWEKQKADVYAYSIILFQLKEMQKPWKDEPSAAVIKECVLAKVRPKLRDDHVCPRYVLRLIEKCWNHDPGKRPDFPKIVSCSDMVSLAPSESIIPPALKGSGISFSEPVIGKRDEPENFDYGSTDSPNRPVTMESVAMSSATAIPSNNPHSRRQSQTFLPVSRDHRIEFESSGDGEMIPATSNSKVKLSCRSSNRLPR